MHLYRVQPIHTHCRIESRKDQKRRRRGAYFSDKVWIPFGMIVEYESLYDRMDLCAFALKESVDFSQKSRNNIDFGIFPMNLDSSGKRKDITDGKAYTKKEFLEEYGDLKKWDKSFPHGKVQLAFDCLEMKSWGKEIFLDEQELPKLEFLWSITVFTYEADAMLWNFVGKQMSKKTEYVDRVHFTDINDRTLLKIYLKNESKNKSNSEITMRQFVDLMNADIDITNNCFEDIKKFQMLKSEKLTDDFRAQKNMIWKMFRNMTMQATLMDSSLK